MIRCGSESQLPSEAQRLPWLGGDGGRGEAAPNARPTRSSLPHIGFSARNDDWNRVQQSVLSMFRREKLEPSELVILGARMKDLSTSDIGPFIYEYYKNQLLMKGMRQMREGIRQNIEGGFDELASIGEVWDYFYQEILPMLHYILHSVNTKDLTIKQATLEQFRNHILFRFEIKDLLEKRQSKVPANIRQMLLVLQSVPLETPPSEDYLKLETLVALVVDPYLGYRGLYAGSTRPTVSAFRTESTKHKRANTTVQCCPGSVAAGPVTTRASSIASLKPVVEHDRTQELRRHSLCCVTQGDLRRQLKY